jgi:hypothetical protein
MPTRYLNAVSQNALEDVIASIKSDAGVDININTAIIFLYNFWKEHSSEDSA